MLIPVGVPEAIDCLENVSVVLLQQLKVCSAILLSSRQSLSTLPLSSCRRQQEVNTDGVESTSCLVKESSRT